MHEGMLIKTFVDQEYGSGMLCECVWVVQLETRTQAYSIPNVAVQTVCRLQCGAMGGCSIDVGMVGYPARQGSYPSAQPPC